MIEERREQPRNYVDKLEKVIDNNVYTIDGLKKIKKLLQLEQKIDNLVFENLILEDSLINNYLDDGLIETIIL